MVTDGNVLYHYLSQIPVKRLANMSQGQVLSLNKSSSIHIALLILNSLIHVQVRVIHEWIALVYIKKKVPTVFRFSHSIVASCPSDDKVSLLHCLNIQFLFGAK